MPSPVQLGKLAQQITALMDLLKKNEKTPEAGMKSGLDQLKDVAGQIANLPNVDSAHLKKMADKTTDVLSNIQKGNWAEAMKGVTDKDGLGALGMEAVNQSTKGAAAPSVPKPASKNSNKDEEDEDKQEKNATPVQTAQKGLREAKDAAAIYNAMTELYIAKAQEMGANDANVKNLFNTAKSKISDQANKVYDAAKEKYEQSSAGQKATNDQVDPNAAPTPNPGKASRSANQFQQGETQATEMQPVTPAQPTSKPTDAKDASQTQTAASTTAANASTKKSEQPQDPTPERGLSI